MSNVPKLRFKEFSGEWEVQRLEQLSSKISDGIHSTPEYNEDGDYYFVNGNNLKNGVIILDENTKRVTKEEALKYYRELTNQTILMSINGTIGNLAFYNNEDIMLGKSACYININDSLTNKHFISNQLSSSKIQYYYTSELTGSTIKNLSLKTIKNTPIQLPSKQEQEKIASFLTSVDTKIQQLTKKEELLSSYKKGVMQKIFSGDIRFKADDGSEFTPWEEKKLGDVGTTFNGLTGKTSENFGTGKPYIQYKQIFGSSKISLDGFGYVSIAPNERQNKAQFGDIFFTTSSETPNEVAFASVLLDDINEVYLNSFCFGYRAKSLDVLNPYFARFLFRSSNFRREAIKLAQGSTRYNISKVELMKTLIQLPCLAEQTKIANFLSSIDSKIEQVQKQLDSTKEFKKALLQQMFV